MSISPDELNVKKNAAVTALFSLYKAAGDASSAVLDLINYIESTGLDVKELRAAFTGSYTPSIKQPDSTPDHSSQTQSAGAAEDTHAVEQIAATTEDPESAVKDAADGTKKKAKRAPRDPNAPKRPLNAFLKFRNQESKKISEDRKSKGEPDLSRNDMSAIVKEHWDNLPESVRSNLIQESKNDLERYHADLASYKESSTNSLSQLESSQATQDSIPQGVLTQEEQPLDETEPVSSPQKKKSKKRDDSKKDEKEKKKRKKQATE